MKALLLVLMIAASSATLQAQQSIGTVDMQDAVVSGDLSVSSGHAVLAGSSSVVAKDHTAEVSLQRGGVVRVCATSGVHLAQSRGTGAQPLMLALDHGAMEVRTSALANDVVITPDLRFAFRAAGPLDLRLRVTKNGDTCVENNGTGAPILGITDQFGEASYELNPGQHVLFEHGSLKEVVDHESSPCGCPAQPPELGVSIADALLASGKNASAKAAEQHPFPAAVSQGLAPPPPVPLAPAGEAHAQVSTTLGFAGEGGGTISGTPVAIAAPQTAPPTSTPPPPAHGLTHRIGRFFKRLFGGG